MIKEILYNKRGNFDTVNLNEEYWNLMNEAGDLCEELEKGMTDEIKAKLGKLCDLFYGMEAESSECYYIEGVKVGILLGVEACN